MKFLVTHHWKGMGPHSVDADDWQDVLQILEDAYRIRKEQELIVSIVIVPYGYDPHGTDAKSVTT